MEPIKFYSLRYRHGDWANHHKGLREYIKLLEGEGFCVSKVLTDAKGSIYFEMSGFLTLYILMDISTILGQELIINSYVVKIYDDCNE